MSDLVIGIVIMGLLSAILLVAMLRLSRSLAPRTFNLIAIMLVAMLLANSILIRDTVLLTRLLPVPNLIVVGNFAPLIVAALGGLIWYRVPGSTLRRTLIFGSLVGVCLFTLYAPILSAAPRMNDRWDHGVCLQTSHSSCSPAAAATLLNLYKIKTTEQEMAMLCLTTKAGTSAHGLWRGLLLKTAGSGYDVYMFDKLPMPELRTMLPALLTVELREGAKVDPRYVDTWGWIPGVPHTVVVLAFEGADRVVVADPATGRETWSLQDLAILWHGTGARLVRSRS